MRFVEVVVDVPVTNAENVYDYIMPVAFYDRAVVGSRVLVPFGKRKVEGYIIEVKSNSSVKQLKEIIEVLDETPPLTKELIELGKYISDRYLAPLFMCLQIMVPASLRSKYVKWIEWNSERDHLPLIVLPEEEEVLLYVKAKKEIERKKIEKKFPDSESILDRFISKGFLREVTKVQDEGVKKVEKVVHLRKSEDDTIALLKSLPKNANAQRQLLEYLLKHRSVPLKQIMFDCKISSPSVKRLVEMQVIEIAEVVVRRDPYANQLFKKDHAKPLTKEQDEVFQQIICSIQSNQHQAYLLHGVTGSGKTEIYLQTIDYVLRQNKEAIMLVPEISLTPMMVNRFKSRFGEKIAVLHSALSSGEKLDEWRRILSGEAKVVVGARSAIFAPVPNLGIIIVDEEHETTYKQEETPRYHVRDVAMKRAVLSNSVVLFGSATPSLESYAYALANRYQLLEMKNRVNEQQLPKIHLVDMRNELHEGHRHMFSRLLLSKIEDRLKRKEQIVLLLNRRGYSTFVICRSCGYTAECPHCDITLTYHQTDRTIRCHYCGYVDRLPSNCPKCESDHIRFFGTGTQRIEEELAKQFPGIRVIRMDMDTTSQKGAHERMLAAFGNFEADVLLGTQMIAKGLDFPKVSLVGMISADTMLHLPDFRSSERTYQLITQVAGRAGRHEIPGEVVVQTYSPDHYSVQLSVQQNYVEFFNHEIKLRKLGNYPPFYRICMIHFAHEKVPVIVKALGKFIDDLRVYLSSQTVVYGPVPAAITRIKDRYRYHCMIKYKNEPKLNQILKKALANIDDVVQKNKIHVSIDIDPQYIL